MYYYVSISASVFGWGSSSFLAFFLRCFLCLDGTYIYTIVLFILHYSIIFLLNAQYIVFILLFINVIGYSLTIYGLIQTPLIKINIAHLILLSQCRWLTNLIGTIERKKGRKILVSKVIGKCRDFRSRAHHKINKI